MSEENSVVHVGDGWGFCAHLRESCHDCRSDVRGMNNRVAIVPWLKKSGWPQSEIKRVLGDELDMMRRPAIQLFSVASQNYVPNVREAAVKCKAHSKTTCLKCFDFGAFLLQDAELWGKHLAYLKNAGLPTPAPPAPPPSGVFERLYPRLRGFPDISAVSLPSEHTLTFRYPNFRLLNQLPTFDGHSPRGWVLFGIIVAHQGPGMIYTIQDASGDSVKLQFVESWKLLDGGGEPTGKDAEQYKNLALGTVLSLKCITMNLMAKGVPQRYTTVEKINLSGVQILKCSIADLNPINDKLRNAGSSCCAHCAKASAPSSCRLCKSPYCNPECQAKDWKEGGHKKTCAIIAHLRSLNYMFADG
ncbi:hypothetical protein DFH06DRAFT_1254239 [Mycena polygramma]|nr:hypothetical protein DFH06DRAFT_1254239 [Mycena polygramma]